MSSRQSPVDDLFQAYADSCAGHDEEGWRRLLHPRTIEALSHDGALVLRYHRTVEFRSAHAPSGWQLAPLLESTETSEILQFTPTPHFVARRTVKLPLPELEPVVGERMLAEDQGQLRFVLRNHEPRIYPFLRESIAHQEGRWAEARSTAEQLAHGLIDEIASHQRDLRWMRASRVLRSQAPMSGLEALAVVQVIWADRRART